MLKRLISSFLLFTLLFQSVTVSADMGESGTQSTSASSQETIPDFPEAISSVDWSAFDWNKNIYLPSQRQEYLENLERYVEEGNTSGATSLQMQSTPAHSDEGLATLNAPVEVKEVVKEHYEGQSNASLQSIESISSLQQKLEQVMGKLGTPVGDQTSLENTGDLPEVHREDMDFGMSQKVAIQQEQPILEATTLDTQGIVSLLSVGDPVVNYFTGIEDRPVDYGLYYLQGLQTSEHGLVGTGITIIESMQFLKLLETFHRTQSDEYLKLSSYFANITPKNHLESILKARYSNSGGVLSSFYINTDGGVGISDGYDSDFLTTLYATELLQTQFSGAPTQMVSYLSGQIDTNGSIQVLQNINEFKITFTIAGFKINFTIEKL